MKKTSRLFLVAVLLCMDLCGQNFTWVRGSTLSGLPGIYGTMNVPAPGNDPGGRHGAATWIDGSGNLWLFGGEGYSATAPLCWLNDLWKYDPSTNQWTWIRGSNAPNAVGVYGTQNVASPTNQPGAREFATAWTDAAGIFWLFGGDGFGNTTSFGRLGDLWKYNPVTNQWTWVKGFTGIDQNGVYGTQNLANAANLPGSRLWAAPWTDGNNLYMFGGRGYGATGFSGYLNDFWVFNISSNNWTWMSGSQVIFPNGLYGTQGTPSTANIPGGRAHSSTWTDAAGNFYLFGGLGSGASLGPSYLNDLWKYNPGAGTWVWLSGSNSTGTSGSYGFKGIESATSMPGARYGAAAWRDAQGNLWLFGGQGYDSTALTSYLNCLFRYNPSNNRWTWMKGSKTAYVNGNYGTAGLPAPTNIPGSRSFNTWWPNQNGKFWFLGGEGLDIGSSVINQLNDLWYYIPPCNPDSLNSVPGQLVCSGSSVSLSAYNQYPGTVTWYNSPSSGSALGQGSVLTVPSLNAVGSATVYAYYASTNACTMTPRTSITVTVMPLPVLSISGTSVLCYGSPGALIATGASSYTWSTGTTGSSTPILPTVTPVYTCSVVGSNTFGCTSQISHSLTVNALPTVAVVSSASVVCKSHSVSLTASGATNYSWSTGATGSLVVVNPTIASGQGNVAYTVTGTDQNGCSKTTVFNQPVSSCAGLFSEEGVLNFELFPNPSHSAITLVLPGIQVFAEFSLYTALGQKVLEQLLRSELTEIRFDLPAGVYFYRVQSGEQSLTGKLIVH